MEEAFLVEKLLLFGLGRQEAGIYLCLLKNEALTGYEVSKLTGISRSNVYNGLASLVEHGAAYICEGPATKYVAVSMAEFLDNRLCFLEQERKELIANTPKKVELSEGYITIEGYNHICDKIHHMLTEAEQRVYFSADKGFIEKWREELEKLVADGKKVVLITRGTSELFADDDMLRQGIVFYEAFEKGLQGEDGVQSSERQLRLIIDSKNVLTGEMAGTAKDTCLYSAQKNFVAVFKDALRNEIELIKLQKIT